MMILMALLALAAAAAYYSKRLDHEEESERSGALLLLLVSALAVAASALHLVPDALVEAYAPYAAVLAAAVPAFVGIGGAKRALKRISVKGEPVPMAD